VSIVVVVVELGIRAHGVQVAEAGGARGDVGAVGVGHAGRLVDQAAQHAVTRVTHGGSAP
jgi:hypothetical protein